MKAKIIKCSDAMMWYRDSIGKVIEVVEDRGEFLTRDNGGFINIVRREDVEILEGMEIMKFGDRLEKLVIDPKLGHVQLAPLPMTIVFSNPLTKGFLGKFMEKDGLLTFEGNVDEAGKVFIDFICKTFDQRIEYLINQKMKNTQ